MSMHLEAHYQVFAHVSLSMMMRMEISRRDWTASRVLQ